MTVLMEGQDLRRHYPAGGGMFAKKGVIKAIDGVSFQLHDGQTLAVVGESGCGKSTLARMVTLMEAPTAGELLIDDKPTSSAGEAERRRLRLNVQMVFQNPYGSLNPRKTIGSILEEPLALNGRGDKHAREQAARAMMDRVGLRQDQYGRYPHMFSGGQRQRIAIARALMLNPRVVVADEPVSALDVSVQGQIVNLLQDLQERFGIAYLFVAHDLAVVRHIAHRVAVMYLGVIVETAPVSRLFAAPHHPYTQALLSAAPEPDPDAPRNRIILQGDVPSPMDVPSGCRFRTRCPIARVVCGEIAPPQVEVAPGHYAACHFAAPNPIKI